MLPLPPPLPHPAAASRIDEQKSTVHPNDRNDRIIGVHLFTGPVFSRQGGALLIPCPCGLVAVGLAAFPRLGYRI